MTLAPFSVWSQGVVCYRGFFLRVCDYRVFSVCNSVVVFCVVTKAVFVWSQNVLCFVVMYFWCYHIVIRVLSVL